MTEFPRSPRPIPGPPRRARRRQDMLTKPPGALGRLEDLSVWVASCQGSVRQSNSSGPGWWCSPVTTASPRAGVSAYPPEVTAQMVANIDAGGAAINVLAEVAGATVRVVDIAVDTRRGAGDGATRCAAPAATSRSRTR